MQPQASINNNVLQLCTPILRIDLNHADAVEYNRISLDLKIFQKGNHLETFKNVTDDEWKSIASSIKRLGTFNVCQWACFSNACITNTQTDHAGHEEVSVNFSSERYSLPK